LITSGQINVKTTCVEDRKSSSYLQRKENQTSIKMFHLLARHWWFTPAILPTQEAEIRRIMFEASLGK
jgi:hypothetical protein